MTDRFTAQDYRRTKDSLQQHNEGIAGTHQYDDLASVTRRFLDRYQICGRCNDGTIFVGSQFSTDGDHEERPCPDCVGGLVPNRGGYIDAWFDKEPT